MFSYEMNMVGYPNFLLGLKKKGEKQKQMFNISSNIHLIMIICKYC